MRVYFNLCVCILICVCISICARVFQFVRVYFNLCACTSICACVFQFVRVFALLGHRKKGFKRPILAQVIYFTHLKILFVKEGFNICAVRAVCHVTDAKKFNLLCFSVGNLIKKDSRMFYL